MSSKSGSLVLVNKIQIALIETESCIRAEVEFWRRKNAPVNKCGHMNMHSAKTQKIATQELSNLSSNLFTKCTWPLIFCPHLSINATTKYCCNIACECGMNHIETSVLLSQQIYSQSVKCFVEFKMDECIHDGFL